MTQIDALQIKFTLLCKRSIYTNILAHSMQCDDLKIY